MTIKDAEEQYNIEILSCREQYLKHAKKAKLIWNIISAVLIITGIILTAIGFTTPPEIDSFGFEWEPIGAIFEKCYGIVAICLGVFYRHLIYSPFQNQTCFYKRLLNYFNIISISHCKVKSKYKP